MKTRDELHQTLTRIDGRGYKAYKQIQGEYDFHNFTLLVDHVQGDPYAAPSRFRVLVGQKRAAIPPHLFAGPVREMAVSDFLARAFGEATAAVSKGSRGIGKSGLISIDSGGQEVLRRTAMFVSEREVEARFVVGLPARGRTILGREAADMMTNEVPRIVEQALFYAQIDHDRLRRHVEVVEDQEHIRSLLADQGLVAFVADGAILPRRSGIDDRPLQDDPIPFKSPERFRTVIAAPNRGEVE
ncbi:MAG: ABC-ATPase domain-containing protein, partial [bacterium]|nr:ABC-ATPase domain-containing protein [bacterium]